MYIDDIIIWLKAKVDHMQHLQMVLEVLHTANLHLNPKKCQLYQTELDFLGHHISMRGIEANDLKANKNCKLAHTKICNRGVLIPWTCTLHLDVPTKTRQTHVHTDTINYKSGNNQISYVDGCTPTGF